MRNLSIGDIVNLLIAHEAAEVSEGRLVELLDLDRVTFRGWRLEAIKQGQKLAERTPEEMDELRATLATYAQAANGETMTAPEPSSGETSEPEPSK